MKIPEFVKAKIREGRNYIGGSESPDYSPMDKDIRIWVVTKRFECCGCTGVHVEYRVNGNCRRKWGDLILEQDGTIY